MTDHPCKGMTKAQREAFERIATGQQPRAGKPTIDALLKRKLVDVQGFNVVGRDSFGEIVVPNFVVPIGAHVQWCQWALEQPDAPA